MGTSGGKPREPRAYLECRHATPARSRRATVHILRQGEPIDKNLLPFDEEGNACHEPPGAGMIETIVGTMPASTRTSSHKEPAMDSTSPLSRRGFVGLAASAAALAPLAGRAARPGPRPGFRPRRRPLAGAEGGRGLLHLQQAAPGRRHPGHPPRRGQLRLDQGRPPAAQEHRRAAQGGRREVPRRGHHAR